MPKDRAVVRGRIALVLLLLFATSCSAGPTPKTTALNDDAITVASFNFPESELLAELYGLALRSAGYHVEFSLSLGTREQVEPALQKGLVELVPEYSGSALDFVAGPGSSSPDARATHAALARAMAARGISVLASSPAQDQNGFAVTATTASRYGLRDVSDLAPVASRLVFGGPPECAERPLCLPGLGSAYGLSFKAFVPLDEGGPMTVAALQQDQVQVALMFTSDGQIQAGDLVLLKDDRHLEPAENVTPLLRTEVLSRFGPGVAYVVNRVSAALTTDELRSLNAEVSDGRSPAAAASAWLAAHGLQTAR
jgi:osmoprotectant transport system substrate-binding protein